MDISKLKHRLVTETYYEVSLRSSNRGLSNAINEFLDGSPDIDQDDWTDNTSVMRDYEGDFEGIKIYSCEETSPIIKFICEKLDIDYEEHGNETFHLTI